MPWPYCRSNVRSTGANPRPPLAPFPCRTSEITLPESASAPLRLTRPDRRDLRACRHRSSRSPTVLQIPRAKAEPGQRERPHRRTTPPPRRAPSPSPRIEARRRDDCCDIICNERKRISDDTMGDPVGIPTEALTPRVGPVTGGDLVRVGYAFVVLPASRSRAMAEAWSEWGPLRSWRAPVSRHHRAGQDDHGERHQPALPPWTHSTSRPPIRLAVVPWHAVVGWRPPSPLAVRPRRGVFAQRRRIRGPTCRPS
jgi:hypothetical protein